MNQLAPLQDQPEFRKWIKTLKAEETDLINQFSTEMKEFIEIGEKDNEGYVKYADAIIGRLDREGLIKGNVTRIENFITDRTKVDAAIPPIFEKQEELFKLSESWREWDEKQKGIKINQELQEKIKEGGEKISPYIDDDKKLEKTLTAPQQNLFDLKELTKYPEQFMNVKKIFENYRDKATSDSNIFQKENLSILNKEERGKLRLVELYSKIEKVSSTIQRKLSDFEKNKVKPERLEIQQSMGTIARTSHEKIQQMKEEGLSPLEQQMVISENAKELKILNEFISSLDFNINDKFEEMLTKIESDYKDGNCSDEVYEEYLKEIDELYDQLQEKIAYFEKKVEEKAPVEIEQKESSLSSFFNQLWAGFKNLLFGKTAEAQEETKKETKIQYIPAEQEALMTKRNFSYSFFNPSKEEKKKNNEEQDFKPMSQKK